MPVPCRIYQYGDPNIAGGIMDRQIGRIELQITPPNTGVGGGVLPITPEGYMAAMAGLTAQEWANTSAMFMAGVGQTDSGSGTCSEWADLSGNGRSLLQATGGAMPEIQSDGSLLFNGTSHFMKTAAFTSDQPLTYYIVFNQVTWSASGHILDGDTVDSAIFYQSAVTPDLRLFAGAFGTPVTFPLDTRTCAVIRFNGANSFLQNKSATPTVEDVGAQNPGGLTLGAAANAAAFANVQVWELIIKNGADSAETINKYLSYFYGKYSITP